MAAIVYARGLARTFRHRRRTVRAVRGIDLSIEPGEIAGFLGPNGAGKTSTLRMLTTLLRPTAGTARVAGIDLRSDPRAVRRRIGYVPQGGSTDRNCTVTEELQFQAAAYRMDRAQVPRRIAELRGQLDLAMVAGRRAGTLSGGQRRRLDIALGLIHSPDVLFLDEPTAGLDPQSRANLWEHIRQLRDQHGTTVFLSTHYLDEADTLCDRILVIDHGRIIAEDTAEGIKKRITGDLITVDLADRSDAAVPILTALPQVREVTALAGHVLRLSVDHSERAVVDVITALGQAGLPIRSLQLAPASLEDAFLALTGRDPRDESGVAG